MVRVYRIDREDSRLDAVLKGAGIASSGGEAKHLIQSGQVLVDGAVEARRTARIRPGMAIRVGAIHLRIAGPTPRIDI